MPSDRIYLTRNPTTTHDPHKRRRAAATVAKKAYNIASKRIMSTSRSNKNQHPSSEEASYTLPKDDDTSFRDENDENALEKQAKVSLILDNDSSS